MNSKLKILFGLFLILSVVCLGLTIWSGVLLFKSVNLGRDYAKTSCTVLKAVNNPLCSSSTSECYSLNQNIWWYNYWGPSYFIYISGNNGYVDDDDGTYNEDGGDTGTYNDGGDGDGGDTGGDDGGFDEGGISIDGDMLKQIKKIESTSGASDLSNVREFKNIKKSKYKQQQKQEQQKQEQPLNNLVNNGSNSSNETCYYEGCYQGDFYVQYSVGSTIYSSVIQGLVSAESEWVDGYLDHFAVGSSYYCYYDTNLYKHVVWFEPPKYSIGPLISFIITSVLFLFFSLMLVYIYRSSQHTYRRIN